MLKQHSPKTTAKIQFNFLNLTTRYNTLTDGVTDFNKVCL